jgi:putative lipoprotein
MKKLLIAALIAGSLTLTACDDKEKNALIEQTQKQAQMIEQLNTQVDTLQKQVVDLAENQTIRVEPEVLFEKSETIKFDKTPSKSSDDYAPESAEAKVSVKALKTNMDWLTDLLVNELIRQFTAEGQIKIENKQQLVDYLQTLYADSLKEVKENKLIGMTTNFNMKYLGQRENIATFTIGYYGYSGGAHGMYSTQFLNIDLTKKTLLDIDDVINPDQHDKLKELLWETYSNASNNETFTSKAEFYVEKDFYFSHDGITFVYPPYAIGSFAEGEKELTVYWWQLKENKLLSPQFQNLTQYMMDVD